MRSSRPRRARFHVGPTSRGLRTGHSLPGSLTAAIRATLLGASALPLISALVTPAQAADATNSAPIETASWRDVSAETRYDIPAGPLSQVVSRFAAEAGIQLSVEAALTEGLTSPGLTGAHSVQSGFASLLAGTGLVAVSRGGGEYTLSRAPVQGNGDSENVTTLPPVVVRALATRASEVPAPYAGGQVARGGQVGMLGNRDVMDTPFSVTHYTNQTIQDQQAQTVQEVLANDSSIVSSTTQGGGADLTYARGFWDQALYGSRSLNGLTGMAPLASPSTDYIERVEVFKGPSALTNGMALSSYGSIGGVVNLVTKQAGDEPLTQLTTRYMSRSQWGAHVDVGRRFGAENELGIRFNGAFSAGDTPVDLQQSRFGTAALNLDYRGERIRLSADIAHQSRKVSPETNWMALFGALRSLSAVPRPPGNNTNLNAPWGRANQEGTLGMLRAEVDISDKVTAYASAGAQRYHMRGIGTGISLLDIDGTASADVSADRMQVTTVSMNGGIRARATTGPVAHALSLNLSRARLTRREDFLEGDSIPTSIYHPVFGPAPALLYPQGEIPKSMEARVSSIGVADTLSILDERVQFTAGVRYQKIDYASFESMAGWVDSRYDDKAWTPAFGLVVKPWQHVSLYASYIEGLQTGTTADNEYANVGQVFPPYVSKQHEAGVKIDFGRATTTLAVFQVAQPSAIDVLDAQGGKPTLAIDGEQRNRGVELSAYGESSRYTRLLAGLTYIDARRIRTADGAFDGERAAAVPRMRAVIGGEWDASFIAGLTLTGRLTYTGDTVFGSRPDLKNPSWTQVDLGARYLWKSPWNARPIAIRFNVDNVFDKAYWKVMHAQGLLYRSDPRTYRLSATFPF